MEPLYVFPHRLPQAYIIFHVLIFHIKKSEIQVWNNLLSKQIQYLLWSTSWFSNTGDHLWSLLLEWCRACCSTVVSKGIGHWAFLHVAPLLLCKSRPSIFSNIWSNFSEHLFKENLCWVLLWCRGLLPIGSWSWDSSVTLSNGMSTWSTAWPLLVQSAIDHMIKSAFYLGF